MLRPSFRGFVVSILLTTSAGCARGGGASRQSELAATAPAISPDLVVDARLLLLTVGGGEPALAVIQAELDRIGTPYTVIATSATQLSPSTLSDGGQHGFWSGIILPTCGSGFGPDAPTLAMLSDYASTFGVRSACLYGHADASIGFGPSSTVDTRTQAVTLSYTQAGAALFGWYASPAPLIVTNVAASLAPPADATTTPLLTDGSGNAPVAIHRFADGHELLVITFDQAAGALHSRQLLPGVASWLSRGVFIGEKRAYFGAEVDDIFLGTVTRSGLIYRMSAGDMQGIAGWQAQARGSAVGAGLQLTFAFNGSEVTDTDALTQAAQTVGPQFLWVSHTFDHHRLDSADYARMTYELTMNDAVMQKYAFGPYDRTSLVTPDVSALGNAQVLQASLDHGIERIVCDGSQTNCQGESPNTGLPNPLVPALLMVPRIATNLYADVSTPAEWTDYFNALNSATLGRALSIDEIVDRESDTLVGYLLDGNLDPWMFHQANLRLYDGAHALFTDLADRALQKYAALRVLPVQSLTLEQVGQLMLSRAQLETAEVTGTIHPGQSITIRATQEVRVPVTGAVGAGAERYGDVTITRVDVPAGGEITLPLVAGTSVAVDGGGAGDGGAAVKDGSAGNSAGAGGESGGSGGCGCTLGGLNVNRWGLSALLALAIRTLRRRRRR